MLSFILLFVGLLLIFLEFYTPGGILAVVGAIVLISACITFFATSPSTLFSFAFLLLAICGIIFVIWFALRRIKKSSSQNTFYLSKDQEGYQSSHFDTHLIGKQGIAITDLGPSGFILISNVRYQVTCHGPYLNKGQKVEVIGGEGAHLIVKPLT